MTLLRRDPEEIEAIRHLIAAGATFIGPDGSPMSEEWALQRLIMLNPNMTFGVIRQEPDAQDMPARMPPPAKAQRVDLRKWASPVEQQGNIGGCFANALVGLLELQDTKNGKFKDKSRLFNFYNTHAIAGTLGKDIGATIRDTMKAAQKFGICDEVMWPYDTNKCWIKPPPQCYTQALGYKITAYKYIPSGNVDAAKGFIDQGYPIEMGMDLFKQFTNSEMALNGLLRMPGSGEKTIGGHAVAVVGFDDVKQRFMVRNSWGQNWGDHGYFYMPYDYYRDYTWDAWVVVV